MQMIMISKENDFQRKGFPNANDIQMIMIFKRKRFLNANDF